MTGSVVLSWLRVVDSISYMCRLTIVSLVGSICFQLGAACFLSLAVCVASVVGFGRIFLACVVLWSY